MPRQRSGPLPAHCALRPQGLYARRGAGQGKACSNDCVLERQLAGGHGGTFSLGEKGGQAELADARGGGERLQEDAAVARHLAHQAIQH